MARKTTKNIVKEDDWGEFFDALSAMETDRGLSQTAIAEKISEAIVVASRKDYGGNDVVHCIIDPANRIFNVFARKEVVDVVEDPYTQMSKEDALKIDVLAVENGFVDIKLNPRKFGRIVAQNSRNNFRQGVRDVERSQTLSEFQSKTKEIVSALVQRVDPKTGNATLLIGRAEATLPKAEQVPEEVISEGDHIKVYIVDVKETERGPRVLISRTHSGLVKRLFETEVPEIFDGTVEIKAISRQAGARTKIAVYSSDSNVDPVGACIGNRGVRVNKIVDELAGEKIDVIKYSENPAEFIAEALAPAKVVEVTVLSESERSCRVSVPDSQLSLAIGNKGQNVRLAARLTGWKIDIHPESGFYDDGKTEE